MTNKIIPYNPVLKELARRLRRKSTLCEFVLWKHIRRRALGVEFHRQVPILEYIVDFYCHELRLAIEVDGSIHRYREEEDLKRQRSMERHDVTFIRFTNEEIKEDISNVLWRLQETVEELLQRKNISPSKGCPRYPAILSLKGCTRYPAIPPFEGVHKVPGNSPFEGVHKVPGNSPFEGGARRAGDVLLPSGLHRAGDVLREI